MRTRTKAKIGGTTAKALADHPVLRKATTTVVAPSAKAGLRLGRRRARKRALAQAERLGEVARTAGDALTTYGPQAAEALGLIEPPKPPRRGPGFAAGALAGGALVLFLEPSGGSARRARVAALVARLRGSGNASATPA
jgi:hypothetical protein